MIAILVALAFTALSAYVTYEAHKRKRPGLALFAMFWVGYNAHLLLRQL